MTVYRGKGVKLGQPGPDAIRVFRGLPQPFLRLQVPVIGSRVALMRRANQWHKIQVRVQLQRYTAQYLRVKALQVARIAALVIAPPLERAEYQCRNVHSLAAVPERHLDFRVYPDASVTGPGEAFDQ